MKRMLYLLCAALLIFPALGCDDDTTGTPAEDVRPDRTDAGTDTQVDPATDPVAEPVTDPVTDPVMEPVTDPVTDPVTEPTVDAQDDATPDVDDDAVADADDDTTTDVEDEEVEVDLCGNGTVDTDEGEECDTGHTDACNTPDTCDFTTCQCTHEPTGDACPVPPVDILNLLDYPVDGVDFMWNHYVTATDGLGVPRLPGEPDVAGGLFTPPADCSSGGDEGTEVLYVFEAPQTDTYHFTTLAQDVATEISVWDTVLYVIDPCDTDTSTSTLECNDDHPLGNKFIYPGWLSELTIDLTDGDLVYIVVDAWMSAYNGGVYTLAGGVANIGGDGDECEFGNGFLACDWASNLYCFYGAGAEDPDTCLDGGDDPTLSAVTVSSVEESYDDLDGNRCGEIGTYDVVTFEFEGTTDSDNVVDWYCLEHASLDEVPLCRVMTSEDTDNNPTGFTHLGEWCFDDESVPINDVNFTIIDDLLYTSYSPELVIFYIEELENWYGGRESNGIEADVSN